MSKYNIMSGFHWDLTSERWLLEYMKHVRVIGPNMLIFDTLKSLNKKQFPVYISNNSKYNKLLQALSFLF